MEVMVMLCEKLWIAIMLGAFFVCWRRGWLKKGFYLTSEQEEEAEYIEMKKKEEERHKIQNRAHLLCGKECPEKVKK